MQDNAIKNEPKTLMGKITSDKLHLIYQEYFFYNFKFEFCMEKLERMYTIVKFIHETVPDLHSLGDMQGLTIIGSSGMGKSMLINALVQKYEATPNPDHEYFPILKVTLRHGNLGLKGLYAAFFQALDHPYRTIDITEMTLDSLGDELLMILAAAGVYMIVVDNFQYIKGNNQQELVNQLKHLTRLAHVSLVLVGTFEVQDILNTDRQLYDLCPIKYYSTLEYWNYTEHEVVIKAFLTYYEDYIPLSKQSLLSSDIMTYRIFDKLKFVDGEHKDVVNIRVIVNYLRECCIYALENGKSSITEDIINILK